jgi:hypothetical protein
METGQQENKLAPERVPERVWERFARKPRCLRVPFER